MFKQISDSITKFFHEETLSERSKRMLPGAIYCALAMTCYVLVSSVINVIVFRDLHLAVDWTDLISRWVEYGLALTVAGALVGWFSDTTEGVVWGGILIAATLLIGSLILSLLSGRGNIILGQSIITIIPVLGSGLLVAFVIRMAIKRHTDVKKTTDVKIHRAQLTQLISLVIIVGLLLGVFSLFGNSSQYAIRSLNSTLQNYATDNLIASRFPYDRVPALKQHFGMDYALYARVSNVMSGALDITIRFADGYTVTCVVPQMDRNEQILLDACSEGRSYRAP